MARFIPFCTFSYITFVVGLSLIAAQSYSLPDNYRLFSWTKVPSPPCSSLLNSKVISTSELFNSLTKTINCLDKNQYPVTDKIYQEIFQVKKITQDVKDKLITSLVQNRVQDLQTSLIFKEAFIQYNIGAFIVVNKYKILLFLITPILVDLYFFEKATQESKSNDC